MSDYILVEFNKTSQDKIEILVALLSQYGFNGFEEKDNSLQAFILKEKFDRNIIDDFAKLMQAQAKPPSTCFVALSGVASPHLRQELESRGFRLEDRLSSGPLK